MNTRANVPTMKPLQPADRWGIALCILLIIAAVLLIGSGCGSVVPANKTTSTAQAAQDKFNTTSSEKLRSVVTGRVVPPAVVPPANKPTTVTVSGKDNVVAVMQPEPEPEAAPEPPARRGRALLHPNNAGADRYREETDYENQSGQSSESDETASMFSKVHIPLGVSLILLAIGLSMLGGVIFFAVKYVKSTGAGAAALNLADTGMAKMIAAAEAKLMAASDPKEQALTAQHLAELQKLRGQNARNMRPPKAP